MADIFGGIFDNFSSMDDWKDSIKAAVGAASDTYSSMSKSSASNSSGMRDGGLLSLAGSNDQHPKTGTALQSVSPETLESQWHNRLTKISQMGGK